MGSTYSFDDNQKVRDRKGGRPINPVEVTPELRSALAHVDEAWDNGPEDLVRFEFNLGPPELAPLLAVLRRKAEDTCSYFRPDGTLFRIRFTGSRELFVPLYEAWCEGVATKTKKLAKRDR